MAGCAQAAAQEETSRGHGAQDTHEATEKFPARSRPTIAILKANALLDYDDLLLEAGKLLSRARKTEFTHVFVDEYQDINALQHALLKEFVRLGATLTAIGDPHQAIYSFRGADVSFFERFAEDFKGATILSLSGNYRSAPNLLKASGQIVTRETPLICAVTADIYQQGQLTVYEAPTDKAEA